MQVLRKNGVEFLVGGAYALAYYTGITRDTKDFDLFLRPADVSLALAIWEKAGYKVGFAFTHWLAKVQRGKVWVDVIYRSGNGLGLVDDVWFKEAHRAKIFGLQVKVVPPEELIWQKAYIMERERFDGADVAHLLAACAPFIDWNRLLQRFGPDWRVLWAHLILFGFIYPAQRTLIPLDVVKALNVRVLREQTRPAAGNKVCNGTLLSRIQYRSDVTVGRLLDAREADRSEMSAEELKRWVEAGLEVVRRHKP